MTLDIGNDGLLCKVFPASLQGQALSWFHRLPPDSVDNFRDLAEAFVGQYLWSARHKQNINTLQNIKMRDNESLREFVKRFGQAVLQVEACSMVAVLQIFKRSICPGTPFFESLAKKPPTTMDDLFRRANKYSMLEDDVRAATQQVLVAGQASRGGAERNAKHSDRPRPSDRRQEGPSRPERPPLTSLSISYEKLLPMIQGLSDFKWPRPIGTDPSTRDHSKRQKLLRAASIRERINSIRPRLTRGGPRPIDGTIIFPPVDPTRTLQPHCDALILSLEIGDFDVRRILVDPGSLADLVQASVVGRMGHSLTGLENPGEILSGFNGSSTTSLGDIILTVQAGPINLNVQFSVVQDLSPFNVILGRTWLHYMKAIPSTYHQMIARETGTSQEDASLPESSNPHANSNYWIWWTKIPRAADPLQTIQMSEEGTHLTNISSFSHQKKTQKMQNALKQNYDIFAWAHSDMKGIDPSITSHKLNVLPTARPIRQKVKRFHSNRQKIIRMEIDKLLESGFIREVDYPDWLANIVVIKSWILLLGKGCSLSWMPSPDIIRSPCPRLTRKKTSFITPHDLYCYRVMPFGLKNAGATYQRLMTKIFKPLIGHTVEVYIDDIVVKSKTRDEHVLHLQEVFHLLRKYGMKLNPSKCTFGVSAGKFLGFMVTQRGIEVSPDQVKAVIETPPPRSKKELQRLTGKLVALGQWAISVVLFRCPSPKEQKPIYYVSRALADVETRLSMKGQVMADFVLEYSRRPSQRQESSEKEWWTLRVDGASRSSGSGVGLLLQSPTGEHLEQAIWLGFPASNNEAEYEAILSGLDLALALSISKLRVYSDSQLVVRHVQKEYEAKDARMARYLTKVRDTLQRFTEWTIEKIRRTENGRVDALAGIAASLPIKEAIMLPIHVQANPSVAETSTCNTIEASQVDDQDGRKTS
ncbi:Retrovirus-related Pol polyprotein from transposon 17.6 [Vitis vinifera]|uniref:Retrovirus-related Pol polyprotein from transposon 17.6 n=1 Tax=Vitis vinifera TaxID=29760 RepID=A0A438FGB2_VITVI|nr:Retrovirus-related Pol polyprotein from transposon 17.6 [Vitis vinifera]